MIQAADLAVDTGGRTPAEIAHQISAARPEPMRTSTAWRWSSSAGLLRRMGQEAWPRAGRCPRPRQHRPGRGDTGQAPPALRRSRCLPPLPAIGWHQI